MENKVCVFCLTEKGFDNFYNKFGECKPCNIQRSLKRHYENKDKLSNQQKLFCEKNKDLLLAKSKLNQQIRNYERKIYEQ